MGEHNMTYETFPVGSFEENTTIIAAGGRAWIVDPGAEATLIAAKIEKNGLSPAGILLTHAHFDHIGAIPALEARWPGIKVYVDPLDLAIVDHPFNQFPPDYPPVAKPSSPHPAAEAGDPALWGGEEAPKVIATPGHTPGGVSYYFEKAKLLFSGDTLFAGSCGRTDFPGGSMARMHESLARLMELPDDVKVIPGHGGETTIGRERRSNPYIAL